MSPSETLATHEISMPALSPHLILASSSPYRRALLERFPVEFEAISPNVDEQALAGETPAQLAGRLAEVKAQAVAARHPAAVIIGSDQVADLNGHALGKPGDHATAVRQLNDCSAQAVVFHTAVSVVCQQAGFTELHTDTTTVNFRQLKQADIDAYLQLEKPWDCAGSFKVESMGPLLFESVVSSDPTGLIGLPLIWLTGSLQRAGIRLL